MAAKLDLSPDLMGDLRNIFLRGNPDYVQTNVAPEDIENAPLSIRNNNPGNLRFADQTKAVGKDGENFAQFDSAKDGLDALTAQVVLDTQTRKETLSEFIHGYAPSTENNTAAYLAFLESQIGVSANERVPKEKVPSLVRAIVQMEGGQPALDYYFDPQLQLTDDVGLSDATMDIIARNARDSFEKRKDTTKALLTEVGEGITFGFLGELVANARAAKEGIEYNQAKAEYDTARELFKQQNPELAQLALPLEMLGAVPTGGVFAKGAAKLGVGFAKAGAAEGAIYGAAQGDTFEERATSASIGGLAGFTVGKIVDFATTPSSAGGLKTKADDLADEAEAIDEQGQLRAIQEAEDAAVYKEVDKPQYTRKPLAEAQTAGELWTGLTGAFKNFYDDKLTGVSDRLMRRVSMDVGARYQRADESALRVIQKDLGDLSETLIPVIKIINESDRAKGVMLDFAAGNLGKTFDESVARLQFELRKDLNAENFESLRRYLVYSKGKNAKLNKDVFGAEFDDITYLHTRNTAARQRMKEEGRTDEEIEALFEDRAYLERTRGRYLDTRPLQKTIGPDGESIVKKRPSPSEYDNPIVSDMRRIFKMERLNQIQQKFGVKTEDYRNILRGQRVQSIIREEFEAGGVAISAREAREIAMKEFVTLTPTEFMDAFSYTLAQKGISQEGADFARQQISQALIGQNSAPHPLIQSANSLAYSLTLAGPLSAVLNLADIPLLGAKYGGSAVKEGMKATIPGKFKSVPNADLDAMGLNNQTFGEFVNIINDQLGDTSTWMTSTAEKMRNTADFLMRKSGFAAFDRIGKQGVMRGILKSAADDAKTGKLVENWKFYFNDKELEILQGQLKKHGTDWRKYTGKGSELVEELMFAGLGQQQLISAAGRPAAWARHPNLRPLWALRGFVVKQQALALREVVDNIKAGKPEKAAQFLGRYAAYGAGGYAIINEGRQFIFGDGEVSAGGLARGYGDAWASLLTANTLGLNDYQFGQIKENGILPTFAMGMLPIALTRPFDIAGTAIGVADREYPVARLASELPLFRDVGRVSRNIGEQLDIDPLSEFGGMMTQKRLPDTD
tara:strand:- start:1229 stop:4462 length:3234 start_codon:yes stop_codon:yes gene_type:complete